MNWAAIAWLCGMIVFLVLEATTVSLVSIWFAVGCIGAMVAELLGAPGWVCILIFMILSAVLLACLRPFVKKFIKPKITATNTDAIIGSAGFVTEDIDNLAARGQVKLGSMTWTARSTSGDPICKDTKITVDKIEGVKVFVSPK